MYMNREKNNVAKHKSKSKIKLNFDSPLTIDHYAK